MSIQDIPEIPDKEVSLEWLQALQKHGNTIAIFKAREVLPILLSMPPTEVEAYFKYRNERG